MSPTLNPGNSMNGFLAELTSLQGIQSLSYLPHLVLVLCTLFLMWVGKKLYDWASPFDLEYQLVKADNKAVTLSFVGYLAGVATIVEGVLEGEAKGWGFLVQVLVWGFLGILLLVVAGKINNKMLLKGFDNKQELLEKHNLGVAAAEIGSSLGSAMIIRSILLGESLGWAWDLGLTLFYFVLGQGGFWVFSKLYQWSIKYDYRAEIQAGNQAAGIAFGANLVAMGMLLAIPLRESYSLVYFAVWFVVGSATLAFFRFVMDKVIIPTETLDSEIHQDRNWGVAALEGCFSLVAVVVLQNIFV